MDEYEANLIVLHCSPSPVRRSVSPQLVAQYSLSQKMVKSCRNCKFSFRSEYCPQAEYCSKDCEVSYRWFMKKSDLEESPRIKCVEYYPMMVMTTTTTMTKPSSPLLKTNENNNSNSNSNSNIQTNMTTITNTITTTPRLPEVTYDDMNSYMISCCCDDDASTTVPSIDLDSISNRTDTPTLPSLTNKSHIILNNDNHNNYNKYNNSNNSNNGHGMFVKGIKSLFRGILL